ncbi:MAG: O-antigen ligase family protein [Fluviicola sp.]|nr:O-antigen ligase family protein [Fluviicola sp.]
MIQIFKEKIEKFYSDKNLFLLLSTWLITFFFGSKIGAVSIGFLTIYPNLIIGVLFVPLIISTFFSLNKWFKLHSYIILLFVLYSVVWMLMKGKNDYSIFEFRSWIFHLFSFLILSVSYCFFKNKSYFKRSISSVLWIWFIVLILFGFIEIITGYHFVGSFTDKISKLPISITDYTPVFIFDNPNDYILNCLGVYFILLFVDQKRFENSWLILASAFVLFILSIYCSARISEFILILLMFFVLLNSGFKKSIETVSSMKYFVGIFGVLIIILIYLNPIFKGKDRTDINSYFYETSIIQKVKGKYELVDAMKTLSDEDKRILDKAIKRKNKNPGFNSSDIRKKLLNNGIYLIKKDPLLGVGPGQFQVLNSNKKVPNDIGTNSSPHNYIIEVISNYGILGWIFFGYLGFIVFKLFKSNRNLNKWLIVTIALFMLASFLPSAFIYQPINWLFMSLWIIYIHNVKTEENGG